MNDLLVIFFQQKAFQNLTLFSKWKITANQMCINQLTSGMLGSDKLRKNMLFKVSRIFVFSKNVVCDLFFRNKRQSKINLQYKWYKIRYQLLLNKNDFLNYFLLSKSRWIYVSFSISEFFPVFHCLFSYTWLTSEASKQFTLGFPTFSPNVLQ